jgi:DNA-binding NtrC family response regulator
MSDPVKVLIVDDDPSILSLLEEVFSSDPELDITAQADSQRAYDLLAKEPYDLLITDLMMPQVDGLMLLEHAISVHPDILVVIITGYASLETTLEAIHAGVYDYITKPFRLEEFRLLVNNAASRIRLMHDIRSLRTEKRASLVQIEGLEERCNSQREELTRLREELGRREDLVAQTGVSTGDGTPQSQLSTYQSMLETAEDRYRRQIQDLEELFSAGRLTSDEFEVARQNLKTKI